MQDVVNINDRQKTILPDLSNSKAVIVGVGGIGSWVALDVALIGYETIYIIDPDTVESTNLNRTLFRTSDIGKYKVDAIEELISERRLGAMVIKKDDYITENDVSNLPKDADIFDCTDNLNQGELFENKDFASYTKFGYDGFFMSLMHNVVKKPNSWNSEESSSYRFIPSFFGSPQLISALGVTEIVNNKIKGIKKSFTLNLDIREISNNQLVLDKTLLITKKPNINELLKTITNELASDK